MYNNIGLQTARGSGTNGYVQRNLSLLRSRKEKVEYHTQEDVDRLEQMNTRKPNQEILEHERKRQIELKCMELQDMMEEQGLVRQFVHFKYSNLQVLANLAINLSYFSWCNLRNYCLLLSQIIIFFLRENFFHNSTIESSLK